MKTYIFPMCVAVSLLFGSIELASVHIARAGTTTNAPVLSQNQHETNWTTNKLLGTNDVLQVGNTIVVVAWSVGGKSQAVTVTVGHNGTITLWESGIFSVAGKTRPKVLKEIEKYYSTNNYHSHIDFSVRNPEYINLVYRDQQKMIPWREGMTAQEVESAAHRAFIPRAGNRFHRFKLLRSSGEAFDLEMNRAKPDPNLPVCPNDTFLFPKPTFGW